MQKKETSISPADFRKAVNAGKTHIEHFLRTKGELILDLTVINKDGKSDKVQLKTFVKRFKCQDFIDMNSMQKELVDDKEVVRMEKYAAAVIVGCCDEKGVPFFRDCQEDIDLLQSPFNAPEVINAYYSVLAAALPTVSGAAEKKPE